MRTISYWAKCNIRQARVYIVLIHLILAALAWYMGSAFLSLHISFPRILLVLSVALFLVATVLYPGKSKKLYFRQKCCDVIIVASSFVMICCSGNRQGTPSGYAYGSSGEKGKNNLTRQEKRILRTEFKKELTVQAKARLKGDDHTAEKAWLILVQIIAAVGLFYVLAALACSISGSQGKMVIQNEF